MAREPAACAWAVSEAIWAVCELTLLESWPASERAAEIFSWSDGSLAPAKPTPSATTAAMAIPAPNAARRRRNARTGRMRALPECVVAASISFGACGVS